MSHIAICQVRKMIVFVESNVLEDGILADDDIFKRFRGRLQTFKEGQITLKLCCFYTPANKVWYGVCWSQYVCWLLVGQPLIGSSAVSQSTIRWLAIGHSAIGWSAVGLFTYNVFKMCLKGKERCKLKAKCFRGYCDSNTIIEYNLPAQNGFDT